MQIARHINDEDTLRAFFESGRYAGLEIDVRREDDWRVGNGRRAHHPPLPAFLHEVNTLSDRQPRHGPLKVMVQVEQERLLHDEADSLLDLAERHRDGIEMRFVAYSPDVVNTLYHATMSREDPVPVQIYMQEDDVRGHVQWTKRRNLGLPEEVGYHLRLHAFPTSKRPTYDEAKATGRRISTTGWNPLYRGWRNDDLSDVWNLRRR